MLFYRLQPSAFGRMRVIGAFHGRKRVLASAGFDGMRARPRWFRDSTVCTRCTSESTCMICWKRSSEASDRKKAFGIHVRYVLEGMGGSVFPSFEIRPYGPFVDIQCNGRALLGPFKRRMNYSRGIKKNICQQGRNFCFGAGTLSPGREETKNRRSCVGAEDEHRFHPTDRSLPCRKLLFP